MLPKEKLDALRLLLRQFFDRSSAIVAWLMEVSNFWPSMYAFAKPAIGVGTWGGGGWHRGHLRHVPPKFSVCAMPTLYVLYYKLKPTHLPADFRFPQKRVHALTLAEQQVG